MANPDSITSTSVPDQNAPSIDVTAISKRITHNVEHVIVGKRPQIVMALVAWFSEGHVLLEDVPGVAKTMLARAMARSVGCKFKRIQCTPDLLPTDVTGASIFNQKMTEFEFRAGPLFANIVLTDEINRTTPRTQAALLEAMAESRVTVDGKTYELDQPFLVIATQNPVDHEGTFPLPEAQLDRFLLRFQLGYPSFDDELKMLDVVRADHPVNRIKPVTTVEELIACQKAVRDIYVDPKVREYIMQIVHATRTHDDVALGGSPRASIALFRTAQSLAAIRGADFVKPDDVKRMAPSVLGHRLILKPESRLRRITAAAVVEEILDATPIPTINGTQVG